MLSAACHHQACAQKVHVLDPSGDDAVVDIAGEIGDQVSGLYLSLNSGTRGAGSVGSADA